MSKLDYGILNTPIGSRARGGSIDAQIDRWKKERDRQERVTSRETFRTMRTQKTRVRDILSRMGDYRVMALAKPLGSRTPKIARAALCGAAVFDLPKWLAALEKETIPAGGCAACWAPVGKCGHTAEEWLGPA